MTQMQIVIEIHETPKNDHERWVLAHGTPLPKGHGRLIDYTQIERNVLKKVGIKDRAYLLQAERTIMRAIDITQTVIPADKEGV